MANHAKVALTKRIGLYGVNLLHDWDVCSVQFVDGPFWGDADSTDKERCTSFDNDIN